MNVLGFLHATSFRGLPFELFAGHSRNLAGLAPCRNRDIGEAILRKKDTQHTNTLTQTKHTH